MLAERPRRRKEITFCKFFSEGSGCAFGDSCKFPHIDHATGKETRGEDWMPKRAEPLSEGPTQNEAKQPVRLLVERVPPGTSSAELLTLLEQYGAVLDMRLDTRADGFGLAKVDYVDRDGARSAFAALNASDSPHQFRVTWKKKTTGGPVRHAILYYPPPFATLPPPRPCKFYFDGTCRQGIYCAFAHGDEPRPSSYPYPYIGAYPVPVCPFSFSSVLLSHSHYFAYPFAPFALPVRKAHKPELYKTMPCSNFAKGSCSFGDKCNFVH